MSVVDRIVAQNRALWLLLAKGDDLGAEAQQQIISEAFPKVSFCRHGRSIPADALAREICEECAENDGADMLAEAAGK